jgi:hypothetical protein
VFSCGIKVTEGKEATVGIDVAMKNGVFWDVTPCGSCKNQQRNIPEDGILHSHCRENLRAYIALTG